MQPLECVRLALHAYLQRCDREDWLCQSTPNPFEPFYSSFDIRDAGFKIAPVDANLFPAGFNNICADDLERAAPVLKRLLLRHLKSVPQKVAILPEAHTKNRYYAEHLYYLRQLFRNVGIQTEIGWWSLTASKDSPMVLQTPDGRELQTFPFEIRDRRLFITPFEPDFILLNNDFSSGYPQDLEGVIQPIEPTPKLGWHTRKKSTFFSHYNRLAEGLASAAGIDPWRLQVSTRLISGVDFDANLGMAAIAEAVDDLLDQMRSEYQKREIEEKPFVFVKNNAGTYGMGILRVESGQELLELNRRERNKMAVGKNHLEITEVIVQEGIPTRLKVDHVIAEPVIYLLGHDLIGGFLRTNPTRGKVDNLNSAGMVFQKLCMADLFRTVDRDVQLELVFGVLAHLSVCAISKEIESTVNSS